MTWKALHHSAHRPIPCFNFVIGPKPTLVPLRSTSTQQAKGPCLSQFRPKAFMQSKAIVPQEHAALRFKGDAGAVLFFIFPGWRFFAAVLPGDQHASAVFK